MENNPLIDSVEERLSGLVEDFIESNVEDLVNELRTQIHNYNDFNKVAISPAYLGFIEEIVVESYYSLAFLFEKILLQYSKELAKQFDITDEMHSDSTSDLSYLRKDVDNLVKRLEELENVSNFYP